MSLDEFLREMEERLAAGRDGPPGTSPLTAEAQQVIAAADQGGVPLFTSANLRRIAQENGVDVSADMTPNDIIDALRRLGPPR
jgi:hypothetical protein